MPVTHVLDIRSTKKGEAPVLLAPRLVEAVQARLDRHEQAIIFLNRRGYSSSLQCPQCGQATETTRGHDCTIRTIRYVEP